MLIRFYHLLTTPLEAALPKLAALAYKQKMRVNITANPHSLGILDDALWTYQERSFLPHGREDAHAAQQPILLSETISTANQPDIIMITNGLACDEHIYTQCDRIFDIFNGHDDQATEQARNRWSTYLEHTIPMSYVKQNEQGGWDTLKEVNQPNATE